MVLKPDDPYYDYSTQPFMLLTEDGSFRFIIHSGNTTTSAKVNGETYTDSFNSITDVNFESRYI